VWSLLKLLLKQAQRPFPWCYPLIAFPFSLTTGIGPGRVRELISFKSSNRVTPYGFRMYEDTLCSPKNVPPCTIVVSSTSIALQLSPAKRYDILARVDLGARGPTASAWISSSPSIAITAATQWVNQIAVGLRVNG